MTREEEIIREAKKYYSGNIQCYDAFLHGTEFADEHPKNVWHDVSEEPLLEGKDIIFLNEQDEPFISGKIGGTFLFLLEDFYWERFVELVQISKWAYISDLLPKQLGKSKSDK